MLLFVYYFVHYFLKLSNVYGFWCNLWWIDKDTHLAAKAYQKVLWKLMKAEHDVHFLNECKSQDVYPKIVRWKNIKNKTLHNRIKH